MKKLVLTAGLILSTIVGSYAQLQLTVEKAVEIALDENPTLQVAEMEIERYDYVKRSTYGNHLPQLSVDGTYNYNVVAQQMSKSMQFASNGTNSVSATANLAIPLYAPAIYRTLKLNRTQMESAVETARGSRIDLVAEVKKAFYNILLAEQSLEVLEASSAISKKTVDDTRIKFENGLAAEYDLLTAQVQYSNLQPTIIQTKNSIEVAELMLKMYLSLPEDTDIALDGSLDDMRDAVFNGTDNITTDVSGNSELRNLELQSEMLTQQLKISNSSRLPTVAAYGSFAYAGNESTVMTVTEQGFQPNGTEYYGQTPINVGVKISIPIFSGLVNRNNAKQIENQIKQLELQKFYAEQGTIVQAKSAINNLFTAREKMFAQEETIKQAESAYSISLTRYNAGAGTILELNSAQLAQTQAELNYSQSIYDYLSAKCDYDKIIGKEK